MLPYLVGARSLLHNDMQVVDPFDNPLRQFCNDVVDNGFELISVHGLMVRRRCYTPGRSRAKPSRSRLKPICNRALSSAGERCRHTAEVTGSIPVAPTTEDP